MRCSPSVCVLSSAFWVQGNKCSSSFFPLPLSSCKIHFPSFSCVHSLALWMLSKLWDWKAERSSEETSVCLTPAQVHGRLFQCWLRVCGCCGAASEHKVTNAHLISPTPAVQTERAPCGSETQRCARAPDFRKRFILNNTYVKSYCWSWKWIFLWVLRPVAFGLCVDFFINGSCLNLPPAKQPRLGLWLGPWISAVTSFLSVFCVACLCASCLCGHRASSEP